MTPHYPEPAPSSHDRGWQSSRLRLPNRAPSSAPFPVHSDSVPLRASGGTRFVVAWLLVAASLLAATTPLLAAPKERWSLRALGVFYAPTGDQTLVALSPSQGDQNFATHEVSEDGTGFGLTLEYRVTPHLGIEVGATFVDVDNSFRIQDSGSALSDVESMDFEIFHGGVSWHFTPDRRADLRIGIFMAETSFTDVIFFTEIGRQDKLAFDDDYGIGANFGADFDFRRGGRWFGSVDLRYLVTIMESEVAGEDLDLDPFSVRLGVGFRF